MSKLEIFLCNYHCINEEILRKYNVVGNQCQINNLGLSGKDGKIKKENQKVEKYHRKFKQ
jgi:hypothetical protein